MGIKYEYSYEDDRIVKIPQITELRDLVDIMGILHLRVACSERPHISSCRELGGKIYPITREALKALIGQCWTDLDADDIARVYDIWAECNEAISYCVNIRMNEKADEAAIAAEAAAIGVEVDRPAEGYDLDFTEDMRIWRNPGDSDNTPKLAITDLSDIQYESAHYAEYGIDGYERNEAGIVVERDIEDLPDRSDQKYNPGASGISHESLYSGNNHDCDM